MVADSSLDVAATDATALRLRELVRNLDSDQRRAVSSSAPLLAVIAGAGSGKTSVLTRRVARRCLDGSADPMHTAVITFTRQAAGELKRRLRALGLHEAVMAGTFHALSLTLLSQYWDGIGRRAPAIVQDRRRLIGEVIGPRRTTMIDDLAREIDWARARNISANSYASAAIAAGRDINTSSGDVEQVMADLEKLKRKRGVIDLDDLLSQLIDSARNDSEFASLMRWRLRHLYVDEAQDMNPLQRAVLDVWRGDRDDLTLVGDPSQSIYGFNGSDPTVLTDLENHFPGIEVVRLDTNYRCTPQIVRAGLRTLSHLASPTPTLRSSRPDGPPVSIFAFGDEFEESRGVARILSDSLGPSNSWSQFAVLARTNAQLTIVRTALEEASIPVRTQLVHLDDSLQKLVREVGDLPSRTRLASWARDARTVEHDGAPSESNERETLARVARAVDEFLAEGGNDGRSFLAWVRTHRPFDEAGSSSGVTLATFHSAKGREWDTVVLIGCEEGFLPHSSAKSPFALEEEIRLAYVAETRAADRLVLTHARTRKGRSRRRSHLIDGLDVLPVTSPPTSDFLDGLRQRRSGRVESDPVLVALTDWRSHAARVSGVDPHLICPDDVLADLARLRPESIEDLRAVSGLGTPLISRAGHSIVEAIVRAVTAPGAGG